MNTEGEQYGKFAGRIRPIDVDHDRNAVAHPNRDVLVADDPVVLRWPLIVGRRLVSRGEKRLGGKDVAVFHGFRAR